MTVTLTANNSLSIDQWAELMGVAPLEFNNLDISACGIEYDRDMCSQFWSQWQYNAQAFFSKEQLATFIRHAESQIESYLGYHVAPKWTYGEQHAFTHSSNNRRHEISDYKFVSKWKNVIVAGSPQRITIDEAAEVSYSDEDGDGYAELATVTVINEGLIDLVASYPNRFRFFVPGHNGEDAYELRPTLSLDYDPENYSVTATFNAWQLIRPELYLPKGFAAKRAWSACDPTIYLQTMAVSFEEAQTCKPEAELLWFGNHDPCRDDNCITQTMPACVTWLDKCEGIFKVRPVTVDEDGCIDKTVDPYCHWSREPDAVRLNYLSGCHNRQFYSHVPLVDLGPCPDLIMAILALSVTKIGNFTCACGCIKSQIEYYNEDLAVGGAGGGFRYPAYMLDNPFGSAKRGAIEAYRILEGLRGTSDMCHQTW